MWIIDQIGWLFADIQYYVVYWVDRIEDSWIEMPAIEQYLQSIANALGNTAMYFFNLSDDYDLITERAKDAILGSYYDIDSWLDARKTTITSWSDDLWNDIRNRMNSVENWIDGSGDWLEIQLALWIDTQKSKVLDWVESGAEDILDKMFGD